MACKVYLFFYLILFIVTVATLFNYRSVRRRSKQKDLLKGNTTKFWIVIGVVSLQIVRIMYFSSAFFVEAFE